MLAKSVLRYNDGEIGELVSALVYYGNVALIVNSGTLLQLLSRAGLNNLERLIGAGRLTLFYDRSHLVVHTESSPFAQHRFQSMYLSGGVDGRPVRSPKDELLLNLRRNRAKFSVSDRSAESILRKVQIRSAAESILVGAKSDVLDREFIGRAIPRLLSGLIPGYAATGSEIFNVIDLGDCIAVDTNLDFVALNEQYHRAVPSSHSSISDAFLLSHFLTARGEMYFWGDTEADIWIDPPGAEILVCKVESLEARISSGRRAIERFESMVLEAKSFSGVNVATHDDFGLIVDFVLSKETERFKSWLSECPNGADILREYDRSVIEKSKLFSSLPVRTAKLVTFSGLGFFAGSAFGAGPAGALAGAGLDLALSAGDEFLVSKLDLGWKPSQWVTRKAKPILGQLDG